MSRRSGDDWIEAFVHFTRETEPRASFRRWAAVSTVASALQRKCYLEWGSEVFYPNMYIVLVGPPAARKGTAMREGKRFLTKLGVNIAADESSRQKLINSMREAHSPDQDSSGKITMHSSMTIFSTELTVFLGYEAREMLAMLCKWYDCEDRFTYDTYSHTRQDIPNVWANLFGATTPSQLQASLPEGAVGSGFTSRVVFVFEEDKERVVIEPYVDYAMEEDMLYDIQEIRGIYGPFTLDPTAKNLYTKWRMDSESRQLFTEPRLDYYVQRRPTHLFKLGMIFSAARGDDRIVTELDLTKAITLLHDAERKMPQVFAGVGSNPLAGLQIRIKRVIDQRGSITDSELARVFTNDASDTALSEAVSGLMRQRVIALDVVRKCYIPIKET